jgi:uncharacterized protein with HEPN domain
MKNKISDKERLLHILDSINNIQEFTDGLSFDEFMQNLMLRLACVKLLEIIGEAAGSMSDDTVDQFTNIEWPIIKSFRNILVHEYFGIDYKIVWNAILHRLPELKANIERIIKEFN